MKRCWPTILSLFTFWPCWWEPEEMQEIKRQCEVSTNLGWLFEPTAHTQLILIFLVPSSISVIRGLALGTLNGKTRGQFLQREVKMAASLSLILSVAGFLRAILFKTGLPEAIAVTTALALIVFSSICLGAVLPLLLEFIGVDPAHSSTSIQVVMDILGVVLAVTVSRVILDGPLGGFIMAKLGLWGAQRWQGPIGACDRTTRKPFPAYCRLQSAHRLAGRDEHQLRVR